jgi:hypothetical protein
MMLPTNTRLLLPAVLLCSRRPARGFSLLVRRQLLMMKKKLMKPL